MSWCTLSSLGTAVVHDRSSDIFISELVLKLKSHFNLGVGYAMGESPMATKPGKPLESVSCRTICTSAAGRWELGFT